MTASTTPSREAPNAPASPPNPSSPSSPSPHPTREPRHTGGIDAVRIDQWLHAVRLTKTRADAAAACRGGHVTINGKAAKPASTVKLGDRVEARLNQRERVVDVGRVIQKRVGAAVALDCYVDHSPPPPERDPYQPMFAVRDRGTGRPTKRDKRQIDRLRGRMM